MSYFRRFLAKIIDIVVSINFFWIFLIITYMLIPVDHRNGEISLIIFFIFLILIILYLFYDTFLLPSTIGKTCLCIKIIEKDKSRLKPEWGLTPFHNFFTKKSKEYLDISVTKFGKNSVYATIFTIILTIFSFNLERLSVPRIINRMEIVKQVKEELKLSDIDYQFVSSVTLKNNKAVINIVLANGMVKELHYGNSSGEWILVKEFDNKQLDEINSYIIYDIQTKSSSRTFKLGSYE